jgi:hypothetical protein
MLKAIKQKALTICKGFSVLYIVKTLHFVYLLYDVTGAAT